MTERMVRNRLNITAPLIQLMPQMLHSLPHANTAYQGNFHNVSEREILEASVYPSWKMSSSEQGRKPSLMEQQKQADALAKERKAMVGSGDRSEKIRTYNFPQDRVTDHRIGLTMHQLPEFMDGRIQPMIDALITHFQAEKLKQESAAIA